MESRPKEPNTPNPYAFSTAPTESDSTRGNRGPNGSREIVLAAVAAFCTYFCMYAFRKPFTAGTYENQELWGFGLKSVLVVSQLAGYMTSKFIGIKVLSEMRASRRAWTLVGFILFAEVALALFAFVPLSLKPVMLFLNGLPLGMVFGLVLTYLEGRKQTEALSAALCASFIVSSGVVKSVGRWLMADYGCSEFMMPMLVGAIFFLPLLVSVWVLQRTPLPDQEDIEQRRARSAMTSRERAAFWKAYWPGLTLLVFVYVLLTIVRTIRDDFAVELWRDMGINEAPSIFARSETTVAVAVTLLNGLAFCIRGNLVAIRWTLGLMLAAFVLIVGAAIGQGAQFVSPFAFMVLCGIGMYVPYVAFHTTLFERIVAAASHPGNLVFLMYVADAIGYLGYALVLVLQGSFDSDGEVLPAFRQFLVVTALLSAVAIVVTWIYFSRRLGQSSENEAAT